jgi:hypothetical protein
MIGRGFAVRWIPLVGLAIGLAVLAVIATPVMDWLVRPPSGAADHRIAPWLAWHGRLMVAGWAVLAPAGIIAARYFKIRPGQDWPRQLDDKAWWHAHRWLQGTGIAAATAGLWLAWTNAGGTPALAEFHAILGWVLMVLGWTQIAVALLRGTKGGPTDPRAKAPDWAGDHYSMTRRRIAFEYVHKLGGYAALALTVVAVLTGLVLADAPRWMWLAITCWWTALWAVAIALQRAGRSVDTYQAIWGPGPDLPGNRKHPIGWGVVRPISSPPGDNHC